MPRFLYFALLVTVWEGAEYICSRKIGHSLCCGLRFSFFFWGILLCVFCGRFCRSGQNVAVRECDRDGEGHAF